jgi:hypothetical protein
VISSEAHRRASTELALCYQSQTRESEAAALYEAAVDSAPWKGQAVALLNYAELRGAQERWAEAEGLASRAVSLLAESETATLGAAYANWGTYVASQERYAEAADLFAQGYERLSQTLGADSEYAVAAAANRVRALRANGEEAAAEAFVAQCGAAVAGLLEEPQEMGGQLQDQMEQLFAESPAKQSFDPPGFVREAVSSDEEARQFMAQWQQLGLPTEPAVMQRIMQGLSEAELDDVADQPLVVSKD